MAGPASAGTVLGMCRYSASEYRTHYVCVPCRAVRKEWKRSAPVPCARCGAPMIDAGRDFHTPRRANSREWRKLEVVFADGGRFDSCGCSGPGYCPPTIVGVRNGITERRRRLAASSIFRQAAAKRHERDRGRIPTFPSRAPR